MLWKKYASYGKYENTSMIADLKLIGDTKALNCSKVILEPL